MSQIFAARISRDQSNSSYVVIDSIEVVSVLTGCASLYSMCVESRTDELEAEFNSGAYALRCSNSVITPRKQPKKKKKNCWTKGEGAVDHSTVIRWLTKFAGVLRTSTIMQGQVGLNLASSTRRVSDEFGVSQSNEVWYLHGLNKSLQRCWIVPHITKILQNFWLTQVLS